MHAEADTSGRVQRIALRHASIVVLVGAALNGFVVRVIEAIKLHGGESLLFGISPFELIALAVASMLLVCADDAVDHHPVGWPEGATLLALLVPSSAVSWAALAAYSALLAWRWHGTQRTGALLFLGLAVTALWGSVAIKWLAGPITALEAQAVTALLAPLRSDITVSQNLMGVVGGHQVLLLPACATAYLLPKAILAFAAVTLFMGTQKPLRGLITVAAATALILAFANWGRLAWMTWSHYDYTLAHGPIGANLFDVTQTAIIIAAGLWASR